MSSLETTMTLHGGCHCETVKIEFIAHGTIFSMPPRACDCSFCQKQGAAYLSDANGALAIVCNKPEDLVFYRQGSENARFLMCAHCGILVAVTFSRDATVYGAVNALCLDTFAQFPAPEPSSPQLLSAEEKISRWTTLWMADVSFVYAES